MSRRKGHDPERDAALFVGGALRARAASAFERHLVSCEACWREVASARSGRTVAESLRELAPQSLREDVRAAIASRAGSARSSQWPSARRMLIPAIAGVIALAIAGTVALALRAPAQPVEIAAAIHQFHAHSLPTSGAWVGRAPDLSPMGLSLVGSGSGPVGHLNVHAFAYRDAGGHPIVVYIADKPFPVPAGAWNADSARARWRARYDGVEILCISAPISMMVMSDRSDLLDGVATAVQT